MKIADTLILFFVVFLDYIELSTQSEPSSSRLRHPEPAELSLRIPKNESSSQVVLHSHIASPDISHSDLSLRPPSSPPHDSNRHSPAGSEPPFKHPDYVVLGYALPQLGLIRLLPKRDPVVRFEFRKYTFTPKQLRECVTRSETKRYVPLPTGPQLVLVRSSAYLYAIVEDSGFLSGYYFGAEQHHRLKVDIRTNENRAMEVEEANLVPVGPRRKIEYNFDVIVTNIDTLQLWRNPAGFE